MRNIISILIRNEAGALARVANLFSSRAYNIDSLSVAPTDDQSVSRITLVTFGSQDILDQIIKQTRKLIDVISIIDMTNDDYHEREFALIKIEVSSISNDNLNLLMDNYGASILSEKDNFYTLEIISSSEKVDEFIRAITAKIPIDSIVRSGALAIAKGKPLLQKNS